MGAWKVVRMRVCAWVSVCFVLFHPKSTNRHLKQVPVYFILKYELFIAFWRDLVAHFKSNCFLLNIMYSN